MYVPSNCTWPGNSTELLVESVSQVLLPFLSSTKPHQEFILPHTPEQNGVAESFMGTLKLECVWQHRCATYEEAKATITAWVKHYDETRPHSRLGYLPPVEWRRRQAKISA